MPSAQPQGAHGEPPHISPWQEKLHPSPSSRLPSSHCSMPPLFIIPSPQYSTAHQFAQPSPDVRLPSSHVSPRDGCSTPSPHSSRWHVDEQPSPFWVP